MDRVKKLKEIYFSVYGYSEENINLFRNLLEMVQKKKVERSECLGANEELHANWYHSEKMVGMMLYVDLFAGNIKGLHDKIDYLKELGITYVHFMPLLKPREGENDGGYAVSDYNQIDPNLGDMQDFIEMVAAYKASGIQVCIDYVINHTAKEHEWAQKALRGDEYFQNLYIMYDTDEIPNLYNETVPEVLPDKCPGNFTYYPEINKYVFTSFSEFQWDLNFKNPIVFEKMAAILLDLANTGVNIIRLDAIPFMWKEVGTTCRNLSNIHPLIRMLHLIKDIVCPSVALLGEAIVEPHEIINYYGQDDYEECDLMYNANYMVNIWNSLATRDTMLMSVDANRYVAPNHGAWINYARCHDDIGFGFSEDIIYEQGGTPFDHKQFLISFYNGNFEGSFAKGETYQYNELTKDARINGTLASLAGLEKAIDNCDEFAREEAIKRIILIHSLLISAPGMPLLYSGDELATLNDTSYLQNDSKCKEGRWLHRPFVDWERSMRRHNLTTDEGKVFQSLQTLIHLRKSNALFSSKAKNETLILDERSVYAQIKTLENDVMILLHNVSEHQQYVKTKPFNEKGYFGVYKDLRQGKMINFDQETIHLHPYEFVWLVK
ncbi:MAG TPA: alpha-amylase [Firmicutes bacterium]|nr:alpha-amylase [Bacillota bacterium]